MLIIGVVKNTIFAVLGLFVLCLFFFVFTFLFAFFFSFSSSLRFPVEKSSVLRKSFVYHFW